jgi:hypothetical protein
MIGNQIWLNRVFGLWWEISATDSSANIIIDIKFLNIEFDTSCQYDYLEISESGIYNFFFTFLVFNATFNNIAAIAWRSVLLMAET